MTDVRRLTQDSTRMLTQEPLCPAASQSALPASLRKFALIYFASFVAVWALYHDTNITFLRADSGYYQMLAHLSHAQQEQTIRGFWRTSADGHYTPLAFSAEFLFTKFAGTREAIWRCRQLSTVALVGAALFCLLVSGMRALEFSLRTSEMIAAGITVVFLSNPLTTDYVAWPFHIMQLEWMLLTIMTLCLLLRIVRHPNEKKWPWLAAACGYASMHVLGLGFVTACGTAAVLLVLSIGTLLCKLDRFAGQRRNLIASFAVLIVLTAAHGLCMLLLVTPHEIDTSNHAYRFGVTHVLGLAGLYVPFALLSVFGVIINPTTTADVVQSAWPFGAFVLLAAFATVMIAIYNSFGRCGTVPLARATLLIFSVTGFLALLSVVSVREWHRPSDLALFGFLVGPRYLLPVGIILSGSLLWLISLARNARASVVATLSLGLGLAAYLAHNGYERRLSPRVTPLNCISHDHAWQLIVTSAHEAKSAQLRIPNLPMGALTQEFYDFDLKLFEPLLHDELQLPRRERCEFVDWRDCRTTMRANYDRAVPSLRPLIDLLRLEEKN